jgi:dipeptidyl aminopeptidase/acylaminoacyl peptidase
MRATVALVSTFLVTTACRGEKKATPQAPAEPSLVATVDSLQTPESVKWDSTQDVYFVTNVNGNPSVKDNNGFISRVKPDGSIEALKFVTAGQNGVTLNAPKGTALRGDTLWVTDIDAVRAFDATSGALVRTVDLSGQGAVFLNDAAFGPDEALYITDTGVIFDTDGSMTHPGPDRIFRIAADGSVSVAATGDTLAGPNGILWDQAGNRFIVVAFGGPSVFAWHSGEPTPSVIASGPGGFDGVVMAQRRLLVSSWADSTVSAYETGREVKVITGVPGPADIGYDARRNRVMVPLFTSNRVEIWQLP